MGCDAVVVFVGDCFGEGIEVAVEVVFYLEFGDLASGGGGCGGGCVGMGEKDVENYVVVAFVEVVPMGAPSSWVEVNFDIAVVEGSVKLELGTFEVGAFGVVPPSGGEYFEVMALACGEGVGGEELIVPDALEDVF